MTAKQVKIQQGEKDDVSITADPESHRYIVNLPNSYGNPPGN